MPEQETELRTQEAAEDVAPEGVSATATGAGLPSGEQEATVRRAELEKLKAEFEQLKAERDQLWTGWHDCRPSLRTRVNARSARGRSFATYAVGNVVEQFLPVLDNFELALKATGSAEQLRSGVELIVKQMEEILRQLQVQAGADGGCGIRSAAA